MELYIDGNGLTSGVKIVNIREDIFDPFSEVLTGVTVVSEYYQGYGMG